MKILITGSTGFIGSHLVSYMVKNTRHKIIATGTNLKKAQSTGVVDKNVSSKKLKKIISDIKVENKAEGGRIGYKRGTGLMPKKKSNVDKIKKTFGPKSLGMQSVIYGLDKNPKITKADPKAKFIAAANKKNKKVI